MFYYFVDIAFSKHHSPVVDDAARMSHTDMTQHDHPPEGDFIQIT